MDLAQWSVTSPLAMSMSAQNSLPSGVLHDLPVSCRSLIDLAYAVCPQLLQPGNWLIEASGLGTVGRISRSHDHTESNPMRSASTATCRMGSGERLCPHPSVLVRASRLGELSLAELQKVVQDAWLARASRHRAEQWLSSHRPAVRRPPAEDPTTNPAERVRRRWLRASARLSLSR